MRLTRVTGAASATLAIAAVGALKMGTGCASVLGIDSDRHVAVVDAGSNVVDAANDASAYPPGWECLGVPDYSEDGGTVTTVKVDFLLLNATNATTSATDGTPVPGVPLHACGPIDFTCANPVAGATTDDAGAAFLSLPYGFDGYYEVPTTASFNPSLFFRPPQYVSQTQQQGMADSMDIAAAGAVAGVTQDMSLGFAIVSANDCTGASAPGIVFSVGNAAPTETIVYLKSSVPSTSATQTDATTGSALIFNVPTQSLAVSASFAQGGFIQTITGLGRSGSVSYVAIQPDRSYRTPFPGGG